MDKVIKFVERHEDVTREDGKVEHLITLNIEKSWIIDGILHAIERVATPEDEVEFATEFDAFKRNVTEADFEAFKASKEGELRAEFEATKSSPVFKEEFSDKKE